jgi:hypothetical protein
LVPATLAHLLEPDADRLMIDKLNRLERLGFIRLDDWLQLRDLRNRLSHEYPEQADLRWATWLAAVEAAASMVAMYERWRGRLGAYRSALGWSSFELRLSLAQYAPCRQAHRGLW